MKKLGENIWYSFLNSLTISIFGSIFWLILFKFLKLQDFGLISYIFASSLLLINLFSFGTFQALWKYCSENKFKKIFIFSLLFSAIGIFLIYLISFFYFNNLLIFYISLSLFVSTFLENILFGFQEFKKIFLSNLFSSLSRLILIFLVYYFFGLKVELIALVVILSTLIGIIFKFFYLKEYLFKNLFSNLNFNEVKRFLSLSFSSFLSSFSSFFYSNFLVVSSFIVFSSILAGIIYFSQIIFVIISFFPSIIISAALPLISNLFVRGRVEKIKFIIKNLFVLSTIIIIPLSFLVAFHFETILKIINFEDEIINSFTSSIFLVIAISSTFFLLSNILLSLLFSLSKVKEIYFTELFSILIFLVLFFISYKYENIFYLLLGYFLVPIFKFLLYFYTLNINLSSIFSIKLSFLIIFSFLVSYYLKSEVLIFDVVLSLISLFLIIFFIKTIKIFDSDFETFIKKLNLPDLVKKIAIKLFLKQIKL
ncbi:MAG: oligosaccharide flippase family protein [Candidatus Aenigmatarchaeota archaeon]